MLGYRDVGLAAQRTSLALLPSSTQSVMLNMPSELILMAPPYCAGRRAALKEGAPRRRVVSYSDVGLAAQRTLVALLLSCTQSVMVSVPWSL